ncbi:hypothetical protein ACGFSD_25005 [Streptomyces caniferus]
MLGFKGDESGVADDESSGGLPKATEDRTIYPVAGVVVCAVVAVASQSD